MIYIPNDTRSPSMYIGTQVLFFEISRLDLHHGQNIFDSVRPYLGFQTLPFIVPRSDYHFTRLGEGSHIVYMRKEPLLKKLQQNVQLYNLRTNFSENQLASTSCQISFKHVYSLAYILIQESSNEVNFRLQEDNCTVYPNLSPILGL